MFGSAPENAINIKELWAEEYNLSLKETKLICRLTLYLSMYHSTAVWDPYVFKYFLGCHLTWISTRCLVSSQTKLNK